METNAPCYNAVGKSVDKLENPFSHNAPKRIELDSTSPRQATTFNRNHRRDAARHVAMGFRVLEVGPSQPYQVGRFGVTPSKEQNCREEKVPAPELKRAILARVLPSVTIAAQGRKVPRLQPRRVRTWHARLCSVEHDQARAEHAARREADRQPCMSAHVCPHVRAVAERSD